MGRIHQPGHIQVVKDIKAGFIVVPVIGMVVVANDPGDPHVVVFHLGFHIPMGVDVGIPAIFCGFQTGLV